MRIALLGAPSSGKSLVARRLAARLNRQAIKSESVERWKVVDGYVDRLTKRTGQTFGVHVNYQGHLAVITERMVSEWEVDAQGYNTITCGTIFESIVYAATMDFLPLSEEFILIQQDYGQSVMGTIGRMAAYTTVYDAMLWLPWQGATEEQQRSWHGVINAKLPEVLDGHGRSALPLVGTTKEQVNRALEVVNTISTVTSTVTSPS